MFDDWKSSFFATMDPFYTQPQPRKMIEELNAWEHKLEQREEQLKIEEAKLPALREEISNAQLRLAELQLEARKFSREREGPHQTKRSLDVRNDDLVQQEHLLNQKKADLDRMDGEIREREAKIEELQRELDRLNQAAGEINQRLDAVDQKEQALTRKESELDAREAVLGMAEAVRKHRCDAQSALDQIQSSMTDILTGMTIIRSLGSQFSDLKDTYTGAYLLPGLKELCAISRALKQNQTQVTDHYARELERILINHFGCIQIAPSAQTPIDYEQMVKKNTQMAGELVKTTVACGWKLGDSLLLKAIVSTVEEE